MTTAIRVSGLSKSYVLGGAESHGTFYDMLSATLRAPFRRAARPASAKSFLALRDVSFEVPAGEVIGVVGRNGAGKSTLLKILSRITAPSSGRVEVRGRLASLLEVGTGFHPELSGRENIYLNGAILGMSRAEITRKFDEIVAFAEIEDFVDTAVKRYSSGMYVRLAFGVAAHLETDVLLVDEVLAVGDAGFQKKSLGKMSEVARGGRTVLFVSHNLSAVRNLCSRTLLIDAGTLQFDGATADALSLYEGKFADAQGQLASAQFDGPLAGEIKFEELACLQNGERVAVVDPQVPLVLELRGKAERDITSLDVNLLINRDGLNLTSLFDTESAQPMSRGPFVARFMLDGDALRPGRYMIGVGAVAGMGQWAYGSDVAVIDVAANIGERANYMVGVIGMRYAAERLQ
jgi:lipopolysaccharide transport system ATP-binding protein